LYDHVPPPGDPIPPHIGRSLMEDSHPSDQEVRRAVKKGGNKRSGGASKMQTEDLKICLAVMENKERAREKGKPGYEEAGNTWRMLLKLIQHIWDTERSRVKCY
jgi:hypothetical protein